MDDTTWSVIAVIIAFLLSIMFSYILNETPDRYYVMAFVSVLTIICLIILTKWHPEESANGQV